MNPTKLNKTLLTSTLLSIPFVLSLASSSHAQMQQACGDSMSISWINMAAVYGQVIVHGADGRKFPKVTVTVYDANQNSQRYTIDRNGYYCFPNFNGSGGFVVVDVEGSEVARRSLPSVSGRAGLQSQQDFEITTPNAGRMKGPGSISARYTYQRSEKNTELFKKVIESEDKKEHEKAIGFLTDIVTSDDKDFIAWGTLCSIVLNKNDVASAESACAKSIAARPDYIPAIVNFGRIRLMQNNVDDAVAILQKATELDPKYAAGFQLLGEALIMAKKGTMGVVALNRAIELDPIGMADSHLLMALLYDRAGMKPMASREYKLFLGKVPNHAEKKKFEKYIKDNPPQEP